MNITELVKTTWAQSPFRAPERKAEAHQWLLHNIFFGFAGVWIPFLALCLFGYLRISETLVDGHLVMPAVTLSAVSMGFFVKETKLNLRRTEMPTYVGLMATMILGIIIMIALAFGSKFSNAAKLSMPVLACFTVPVVLSAVYLNFRLFTLELDAVDRGKVKETLERPVAQLTEEAKKGNRVGDVNL